MTTRPPVRPSWQRRVAWLAAAWLVSTCAAMGCARVAPYQREKLAHPTMLLQETAGPGEAHVYAIQEGAVGGGSAVEGGCGCN